MNDAQHTQHTQADEVEHTGAHRLMMIACCIPMLVIAVALLATGVVGPSFLIVAIGCMAMMYFMMRGMSGGDTAGGH